MDPGCPELGGAFTGYIYQRRRKGGCRRARYGGMDRKEEKYPNSISSFS
jgi:hypothetical protein